jgi:hypothetical protein
MRDILSTNNEESVKFDVSDIKEDVIIDPFEKETEVKEVDTDSVDFIEDDKIYMDDIENYQLQLIELSKSNLDKDVQIVQYKIKDLMKRKEELIAQAIKKVEEQIKNNLDVFQEEINKVNQKRKTLNNQKKELYENIKEKYKLENDGWGWNPETGEIIDQ